MADETKSIVSTSTSQPELSREHLYIATRTLTCLQMADDCIAKAYLNGICPAVHQDMQKDMQVVHELITKHSEHLFTQLVDSFIR